jgi:hypothetical protein
MGRGIGVNGRPKIQVLGDFALVDVNCFQDFFSGENGMTSGLVDVERGNRYTSAVGGGLGR